MRMDYKGQGVERVHHGVGWGEIGLRRGSVESTANGGREGRQAPEVCLIQG